MRFSNNEGYGVIEEIMKIIKVNKGKNKIK